MDRCFRLSFRLIGGHHILHQQADIGLIVGVADLHEVFQQPQEMRHVERDGVADVDQMIGRGAQALLGHQLFLVQLFAGA